MFIDSHCHLFYDDFKNDIADVISRANNAGVQYFIVPATNHETALQAIALAEKYPSIFVSVGFHPLDLKDFSTERLALIEEMVSHPKVVAIGEIGIDYFYDTSPREYQKEIFSLQIELAIRKNLPIIVHTRDSVQDAVDIALRHAKSHPEWRNQGKRGVFHCFTGDTVQAKALFDNNFLISFPGPITFKKSIMPDLIKEIGIEHVMVETDSPYLTPVPYRGKRNEPSYIPLIAQKIADTLNISIEEVGRVTTLNAKKLFNLPI
ncbi:MAG: TatD family hydrolase [Bacteroidota bacterium]|nr:TatD family hydrolase [Bacteroidota bacterium]